MRFPAHIGPAELAGLRLCLDQLSAVVLLLVDGDGRLAHANRGGQTLLQRAGKDLALSPDVRDCFICPGFDALMARPARPGQTLFNGVLNLGEPTSPCHSLVGQAYRVDGQLLVLAEHDIDDMARLNAQVIALNEQLGQTQRALARNNRSLVESEARLTSLSLTDPLTGVANRRGLAKYLGREVDRFRRYHEPLSVIMVDIDLFKQVNDELGHAMGDKVLVAMAGLLAQTLRAVDLLARYGGEEFVAVLHRSELRDAMAKAEMLRARVAALSLDGLPRGLSASFGVAEIEAHENAETLVQRADQAVYVSKAMGRNRVTAAQPGPVPGR